MMLPTHTLWRRGLLAIALAGLAVGSLAPVARADSSFHSDRIPLMPVSGTPLQSGFVVDIHTNGPTVYALERYVLNGAEPHTTYSVVSQVYLDPTCGGSPLLAIPDATLQTNVAGNGEASNIIVPDLITQSGLHNTTLGIIWQVQSGGTVVYQTSCISVHLD
jgi:hypothetical protein